MIYLSDDYIDKYGNTLSYLIGRSISEGYSFDYIEKSISYSLAFSELESSNVTRIAFSSMEKTYSDIFPLNSNNYELNVYDIYGWVGYTYMNLFLSLEMTFEMLFYLIPIKEMLKLYPIYHEMDDRHMLDYAKEKLKHSQLDVLMKRKEYSNKTLSIKTSLPISTINALRYGNRDISKLEADKLLLIAHELKIKMETLLPSLHLQKQ